MNQHLHKKKGKIIDPKNYQNLMQSSLRQLRIAIWSTLITIIIGVVIGFNIPAISSFLFDKPPELRIIHEYNYPSSNSLTIRFRLPEQLAQQPEKISELNQRIEFLGRRFSRGQFHILTLPLLENQTFTKTLTDNSKFLSIKMDRPKENNKTLELRLNVRNKNQKLATALQNYGTYLQENWQLTITP